MQSFEQIQDHLKIEFNKAKTRWSVKMYRSRMSEKGKVPENDDDDHNEDEEEPKAKRSRKSRSLNVEAQVDEIIDHGPIIDLDIKEEFVEEHLDPFVSKSTEESPNFDNIDQFIEVIPRKI